MLGAWQLNPGGRINADAAAAAAVIQALACFYLDQHDLIADAVTAAQASHRVADDARHSELAAVDHELSTTSSAVDRYLSAFENGTLEPEDVAGRLAALKTRAQQLRAHRDELVSQLAEMPTAPPPATLQQVASHIDEINGSGSHRQRKALVEALIAQVKITGPGRPLPVFRIPQPAAIAAVSQANGTATAGATNPRTGVRDKTPSVGGAGGTRTHTVADLNRAPPAIGLRPL